MPPCRVLAQDEPGPVERAGEDPGRLRADRSAASTCTARHCCQTIEPARVATRATMIIAVSRAAPRCGATRRAHGACGSDSWRDQVSRTRLPFEAAAGREADDDAHAGRQHRARPRRRSGGRRRCGDRKLRLVERRLAVRPGIALEEIDVPLVDAGRARATVPARCPGTAGCAASCPADSASSSLPGRPSVARPSRAHRGPQRPVDDLQAAFGAAHQPDVLAVAAERRHRGASPGSRRGPAPIARPPSRGEASARAGPGSPPACGRCRRRPATPSAT